MAKENVRSVKEYREKNIRLLKKRLGEEMVHGLDITSEGTIIQAIAHDVSQDKEKG